MFAHILIEEGVLMSFKVKNILFLLPVSIVAALVRCTRMQRRVNRLHTGMNATTVKQPKP